MVRSRATIFPSDFLEGESFAFRLPTRVSLLALRLKYLEEPRPVSLIRPSRRTPRASLFTFCDS
jgi:hypothetical protein